MNGGIQQFILERSITNFTLCFNNGKWRLIAATEESFFEGAGTSLKTLLSQCAEELKNERSE